MITKFPPINLKVKGIIASVLLICNYGLAQTWSAVGNGMVGGYVNTLCTYDSVLYAAGTFIGPGSRIAQWNGESWQPMGSGINDDVYSLCVYKNNLYAGGWFSEAGGHSIGGFAYWNGSTWNAVDPGFQHTITAMDTAFGKLIFNDRTGVYTWNSKIYQYISAENVQINAIAVIDSNLYVAGYGEEKIGLLSICCYIYEGFLYRIKSSGTTYNSTLLATFFSRSNLADVYSLAVHDSNLYIGGTFDTVNGQVIHNIAVYNGTTISSVGNINGTVNALTEYDGRLYAGGYFDTAGGVEVSNIASWNDTVWSPLGQGVNNEVFAMTPFNGDLYVGGGFTSPGNYIARYNPASSNEVKIFSSVTLYPNPNNGFYSIGIPSGMINSNITIYNMLGQQVGKYHLTNTLSELNMQGCSSGVYAYRVETSAGKELGGGKFIIH
jgi:hypothetical protein